MSFSALLPLLLFILFSVAAQLFLKICGMYALQAENLFSAWALNPYWWAALACYGASFICWIRTLRLMPLSSAYPWTALIYVLTPLASMLFLQEKLSLTYFLGILCILCGIFITTRKKHA